MKLAVLESRYWRDSYVSVEPVFQILRGVRGGARSAYIYERFVGKESFSETLNYLKDRGDISRLYIAAHGSVHTVSGQHGSVNADEISLALASTQTRKASPIEGAYFGVCDFLRPNKVAKLLANTLDLKWVAGYAEEVDWGDSMALDLLFFRRLLKSTASTETGKVARVVGDVRRLAPNLIKKLGFNAWWRDGQGKVSGIDGRKL